MILEEIHEFAGNLVWKTFRFIL